MMVNVDLDPHAYQFATAYAAAHGIPLRSAISSLLNRAEDAVNSMNGLYLEETERGYPVITGIGRTISSEEVKRDSEDDPG